MNNLLSGLQIGTKSSELQKMVQPSAKGVLETPTDPAAFQELLAQVQNSNLKIL